MLSLAEHKGTNFTIDVKSYILDMPQEAAQAPIQPFTGTKPKGYVARKSDTLLGNAQKSKISRKYYRSLAVGEAADSIISAPADPQLPPS